MLKNLISNGRILFFVCLAAIFPLAARAQFETATVLGAVRDANEAAVTIQRLRDGRTREKHAQRREREHHDKEHAGDEAKVVQDEFERIREDAGVLAHEERPGEPESGQHDDRGDEAHRVIAWQQCPAEISRDDADHDRCDQFADHVLPFRRWTLMSRHYPERGGTEILGPG